MKNTVSGSFLIGLLILATALLTSLVSLLAAPVEGNNALAAEKAVLAQEAAGNQPAGAAADSARPAPLTAANASPPESGFSLEKLFVVVGIFLVIVLAFLKWGTDARVKKDAAGADRPK